jgi:hypothetical protein
MNIGISGFHPDTTEEEIRTGLEKFGAVVNSVVITPSEDPDRYVATVDIDTDKLGMKVIADKINGKIWKGKRLVAMGYKYL